MAGSNELRLAVLEGDGIGPEITDATIKVLQAAAREARLRLRIKKAPIGWQAYRKTRATLTDMTLAALREHEGWIVGPTFAGEYAKDDPYRGHPNGFIRRHFKLFANVRPVQSWPQLDPLIPDLDITVLRENTEGFYPDRNMAWGYGEFRPREDVGLSLRVITGEACDRFARFCLDYALALGEKRLAIVHKRTALPQTEGLFIGAFDKLRDRYKGIALELVRIDTFSSSFPRDPHRYKLVATTNLFGDILSDQASGLAGGVGLAPSLNAGIDHAMAQAVHGTAPDIAGKQKANPSALILSTAMLLRWFYVRTKSRACRDAASLIERAVKDTILAGDTTPDLGGSASTRTYAKAVVAAMK
ncbi:MAG TPA: isocitrate/isopropylmalate family dehydrogenase [Burkholderiales bacterium]|nr:isocitrate/isopropylmalate family dehydrogenase [Burkholderiales bacterium]